MSIRISLGSKYEQRAFTMQLMLGLFVYVSLIIGKKIRR